MKKKVYLLLVILNMSVLPLAAQKTYETSPNIAYRGGTNDKYCDSACRLDLYYPSDVSGFPTLVWFHGGGLTGGSREIPTELREKGFAIIGVGYRLSPRVKVADCIDDAAAAVAWAFEHIARYGGDTTKIFVGGHSAGGYLSSMIGLDRSWLNRYGIDANRIAALLPYSGQAITHFTRRSELGIEQTQPLIDSLAPLYHVRADAPPILIFSGDRELEMVGRYEENAYFYRMLKLVGHPAATLYELDGFDHVTMAQPAHYLTIRYMQSAQQKK